MRTERALWLVSLVAVLGAFACAAPGTGFDAGPGIYINNNGDNDNSNNDNNDSLDGGQDAGPDTGPSNTSCANYKLSVADYFTGNAVANLTVKVDGSSVSSSGGVACTAALSNGVHIVSITASGYTTWNGAIQVPGGATSRSIPLIQETSAMSGWLAQINSDRSVNGAGAVKLDDMLSIAAYDHAADMVTQNYFAHFDPNGFAPTTRSLLLGSMVMGLENLAAGDANWSGAESNFMSEKSSLPHQEASDCVEYDSEAGHYCNIVWLSHNWVGLAIVEKSGTTYGTYYDQEFADLYGYYDTTVVSPEPSLNSTATLDVVAANGATIDGENDETMPAPTAISVSTLNANPTCASGCPGNDEWYPGDDTFPDENPYMFDFTTKQIYFGAVDTDLSGGGDPFPGYGIYVAAFAGGTVLPTQYHDASLVVASQ